jgi:rhamnulokinase
MAEREYLLALDLGASSGRGVRGRIEDGRLRLDEVHRFPNLPVEVRGTLYWDALALFREIGEAIRRAHQEAGDRLAGVGIDTWGVDFGLLDDRGRLLANPVHYRDRRNEGMMERVFAIVPRERLFARTGLQFLPFNTLFQLMALKCSAAAELERAACLLMMPDLFSYFLCGRRASEFTIATTTQFYDPIKKDWARDLLAELGLPHSILPPIVPPGTTLGLIDQRLPGLPDSRIPVIAPAGHDTGSAVAAVPVSAGRGRDEWAYISSGTWSVMGMEVVEPIFNAAALRRNFTNEGGVAGTFRFLTNISGLWLEQECRRRWALAGEREIGYAELQAMARAAPPLRSLIDPDHPWFLLPEDMPAAIARFCRATGQPVPESKGAYIRCILESLALKYAVVRGWLEEAAGSSIRTVHIVGGGSRDELLNQWAAEALGVPVIAGPAEAAAIGNLMVQAIALGLVSDLTAARAIVRDSCALTYYEPGAGSGWDEARGRFLGIMASAGPMGREE